MSLTLGQLHEKVESFYPEVKQVDNTVLRYTRTDEHSPFAVYYLDIGDGLPQTSNQLNEYLDRVVAKRYFDGASSLQWNSYLFFIRSSEWLRNPSALKLKEFIEQDRTYARKFVIDESELDSVLRPISLQTEGGVKIPDAISPWFSILQNTNLVEAVLGDYTLPERMRLIEQPITIASATTLPANTSSGSLLPPICKFEINEFRQCLTPSMFNFRDVNLLFGVNGSGKTSLLEAIELFYCGKTRRNPKVSEHYDFRVTDNGKNQSVSHDRPQQSLRVCNLEWYGVREEKSTKLYDGFGRFNFLNTDAAKELSESAEDIDKDLAKLLVGSDAANIWQVIEKLAKEVQTKLRGLQPLRSQVRNELAMLNKQLSEISAIKKESDSLSAALREKLHRNQWAINEDPDSETAGLIAELAELKAASDQVGILSWLDTPVTLEIIENYSQAAESMIRTYATYVDKIKTLRYNQRQLAELVSYSQEAMTLIDELAILVESGIEQRASELSNQRKIIASCNSLFAEVDERTLRGVAEADGKFSVDNYCNSAVANRKNAESVLLDVKQEHDDFVKLRDRSLSLSQELRAIAIRILEDKPSDDCPLCHTKFQPGKLIHHMSIGVDEHLEAKAQKLLENVRIAEANLSKATTTEKASNQIKSICARMQLPASTLLKDIAEIVNQAKVAQTEARKREEVLAVGIKASEEQGQSLTRLNEVSTRLNSLGINLEDKSHVKVHSLKCDIEQRLSASRKHMKANVEEEGKLQKIISQATSAIRPSVTDPVAVMAELKERLASIRPVIAALKRFLPHFNWEGSRPIVEWINETEAVRGMAIQFQEALEKERISSKTRSDARRRKDDLQLQEKTLTARINHLKEAQEALTEIQTKHSLKKMTESALQTNRSSIEKIFSQIHSPAEFKAIGPNWTLIRKCDNVRTSLTRISTGQRSAFALAVFLAQNAHLKAGPRAILIDDPIAHIDDLNCLSFLDYLREIALTGTRQIFFATASDKLASLFERKFDFLGNRFKRFNLKRSIEGQSQHLAK